MRIFLNFLAVRSAGLVKLTVPFRISAFHFVSSYRSFNFSFSSATLFLFIIILQASCYTLPPETSNKYPLLRLQEKYSIYLDSTWSKKDAAALLKVFEAVSPDPLNPQFSSWNISDAALENGIKIESKDKSKHVTISRDALPPEESQEILSPEKRLFYPVVQFITENGTDRSMIELIMQKRYGIDVPSHAALPPRTKNNTAKGYSDFENEDLLLIMSVLEEFPQALQKTPQLQYIVRRIDRIDDEDRGISSAMISRGYITFAESIFKRGLYGHNDTPHDHFHRNDTRKIIAHEKAHFLWAYVFGHQLKKDWVKLGGWEQDLKSESGWSTTKDRSAFVTDYAYTENPNEDMAESIGYYFVYPDKLRSCCPEKYEFIHNRIMLTYGKRWSPSSPM